MSPKNIGRGRPRVDSERVDIRFSRDTLDGIEGYAAGQDDQPARPEAIRRLVRERLEELGYIKVY